ncbi:hypothetical protein OG272_16195 [Streptomyces sp. NBC_00104]|uniref:hypothetical protein n=1 Tax=Streptomyces sp. NBC_00104 TaxID=2903621 RepID=UPI00324F6908
MTTSTEVTDVEIARQLASADVSNLSVAKRLGVPWGRVDEVRQRKGLETFQRGRRAVEASWEEAVSRRVKPVEDGHAEWTGQTYPRGTPMLSWRGRAETAYRAVFRIRHGREPQGNITHAPSCVREFCVAGEHLEDRVLREERRCREGGS